MTWQDQRTMSADEYLLTINQLGLSMASAGRYLGVTARTSKRYADGEAEIPVPCVLLLRAMVKFKQVPIVPPWSTSWEARKRARVKAKVAAVSA